MGNVGYIFKFKKIPSIQYPAGFMQIEDKLRPDLFLFEIKIKLRVNDLSETDNLWDLSSRFEKVYALESLPNDAL